MPDGVTADHDIKMLVSSIYFNFSLKYKQNAKRFYQVTFWLFCHWLDQPQIKIRHQVLRFSSPGSTKIPFLPHADYDVFKIFVFEYYSVYMNLSFCMCCRQWSSLTHKMTHWFHLIWKCCFYLNNSQHNIQQTEQNASLLFPKSLL